jgi:hypothetical protein
MLTFRSLGVYCKLFVQVAAQKDICEIIYFPIMCLCISSFAAEGKLKAMVMDNSKGLHKLCGFSNGGPILEIKVSSKLFHV